MYFTNFGDGSHKASTMVCFNAGVRQTRGLWVRTVLLLCVGSSSWGMTHHSDPLSELKEARFCLDRASVNVSSEGPGHIDVGGLRDEAAASVRGLLTSLRVDWFEATHCDATSDSLRLSIEIRFLDPATYRNFAPDTSSYFLLHHLQPAKDSERVFMNSASALFAPEPGGPTLSETLLEEVRLSTTKLAGDWWEQNPLQPRGPPKWLISGAAGAAVALALLSLTVRRVSRGRKPAAPAAILD